MELYYIINYYFKYLELIDTIFLAFKKKPLGNYLNFSLITTLLIRFQHSYTSSIILQLLCFVTRNSTARLVSYVPFCQRVTHIFTPHGSLGLLFP